MLILNYKKQRSQSMTIVMRGKIRTARLQRKFHIWEYRFNTFFFVMWKSASI